MGEALHDAYEGSQTALAGWYWVVGFLALFLFFDGRARFKIWCPFLFVEEKKVEVTEKLNDEEYRRAERQFLGEDRLVPPGCVPPGWVREQEERIAKLLEIAALQCEYTDEVVARVLGGN